MVMLNWLIRKIKYWREKMAIIYAAFIINGKKDFKDVPERLKDKVREVLVDLDLAELAQE